MKFLLFLILFSVTANSQKLLHPLKINSENQNPILLRKNNFDTLKILALRVQFQKDFDERTSGSGEFDLSTSSTYYVDAPPRDVEYFKDHLEFAKNYFQKSSNSKQAITYSVFPQVITLKDSMSKYSPLNNDYKKLANLSLEAWQKADSLRPDFEFEKFNMFIIFHAGVGRDVDLVGTLGYDPTPYDLPSIYFNLNSFKKYLTSSLDGILLKNRNFKITNTAILPETENRFLPAVGGFFHLKLGINGLLASMVGSYLGLPDLFNTKTGQSVIGRFGLMDGQSIFSFQGMFPPEPSAWEKIFLGWVEPITITNNKKNISLDAVSKFATGNDTIYKIPISAKEYFLVENRNRDAKQNFQKITFKWKESSLSKIIQFDDDSLNSSVNNSIFGNVVDVDELDWSLPGAKTNIFDFTGGILIWHIDEAVIEKNYFSNSINNDAKNKGVYLMEADGSNDIGQNYNMLHPAGGTESGSIFDFWFKDNDTQNYKNEFSENTIPNSKSQSGASTKIVLKNFSSSLPTASFDFEKKSSKIENILTRKINNIKKNFNDSPILEEVSNDKVLEIIFTAGDTIYCFTIDGKPNINHNEGILTGKGGRYQPIVVTNLFSSSPTWLVFALDSSIQLLKNINLWNEDAPYNLLEYRLGEIISTPIVYDTLENNIPYLFAGTKNGNVYRVTQSGTNVVKEKIIEGSEEVKFLISSKNEVFAVYDKTIKGSSGKVFNFSSSIVSASHITTSLNSQAPDFVVLTTDGKLNFIQKNSNLITSFNLKSKPTASHSIADLNDDGNCDFIIPTEDGIYAYQWNGVPVENFPLKVNDGGKILSSAIITGEYNSKNKLIFFGTENGHIYCYNNLGKLVSDFPIQTGGVTSSLAIYNSYLAATSLDSNVYVWRTSGLIDTTKIFWSNYLGDKYHTNNYKIIDAAPTTSNDIFKINSVYNWPNPVYENTTFIRYHLNINATVKIKIFTINGEKIQEITGTSFEGMDNEVVWDVSNVQTGIYFAHVVAESSDGKTSRLVKIAVVK